jgi:hypothetical protein
VVAAHSGFLGDCDLAEEPTQETRTKGSIYGGLDLRPFRVVAGRLLPPVSRHGDNGLKASPADALEGGFAAFRAGPQTRVCVWCVRGLGA